LRNLAEYEGELRLGMTAWLDSMLFVGFSLTIAAKRLWR
jgi:hypothetical protein